MRHATDDVDEATRTLCGVSLAPRARKPPNRAPVVDNAQPTCRRCLRSIARRLRGAAP